MKMTLRSAIAALSLFALAACGGTTAKTVGDVSIGARSVHVTLESSFGEGVASKYAIKPNTGTEKPDSVQCWWGGESDSDGKVKAGYDSKDLDFDCIVLTKNPSTGKLFIELTYGATSTHGSIAVAL